LVYSKADVAVALVLSLVATLAPLTTHAAGQAGQGGSAVSVIDDSGRTISLPAPARRIVSLAPHATELLFAAGAGTTIVGVTDYSDYPAAARSIAGLGSAAGFDVERIAALRPDLVVAWGSGNPASKLAALRTLGLQVYESEPRTVGGYRRHGT
jgi:iron complex transport system substrate-binding protein